MSETATQPGLVMVAIDPAGDLAALRARYGKATLPAVLDVPGVSSATEWEVTKRYAAGPDGGQVLEPAPPSYVVAYELDDVAMARNDAFLAALSSDYVQTMSVTLRQLRNHLNPEAASVQARAMMVVSITPAPEYVDLFQEWYDTEHIGELMSCPGFLRTRRYEAQGEPSFFALYELDSPEALQSERFLYFSGRAFEEFPPVQQQVGPHMAQNICDVYELLG